MPDLFVAPQASETNPRRSDYGYSTRQVAGLTGLPSRQIRHFVERGLIEPERGDRFEYRFGFQDLVLLRTARRLLDGDVKVRRTFSTLKKLRNQVTDARALSSLPIFADGDSVVLRGAQGTWDAQTGQGLLNFAQDKTPDNVASLAARGDQNSQPIDELDSDDWYNLGLELEEVDPNKAPDAYRQAINLDPENADAHVNLGRLCQLRGDLKSAKRHYQRALETTSSHQLAYYNMGTVFDELDEIDLAVKFYRKALSVADAHYNLARIYEIRGDRLSSLRHLRQYRRLMDLD
ncbi:MAG: tetratricopeptide repeat protein [Pseudomonadales bacterium]|nr:tetratricopeptide repeat protein [Pseudomonadales bacterium]